MGRDSVEIIELIQRHIDADKPLPAEVLDAMERLAEVHREMADKLDLIRGSVQQHLRIDG